MKYECVNKKTNQNTHIHNKVINKNQKKLQK